MEKIWRGGLDIMNKLALVMMIFGCTAVWGGLIVTLLIAVKKGKL